MNSDVGVRLEGNHVLLEEQYWIARYGEDVILFFNDEYSVTRDKYNSIKSHPTPERVFTFKAYPVVSSPTQKQLEKAGIQEICDVMITLAHKDFLDNNLDVAKDLDGTKCVIDIRNERYNLKGKSVVGQVGDQYSTVSLGLTRK